MRCSLYSEQFTWTVTIYPIRADKATNYERGILDLAVWRSGPTRSSMHSDCMRAVAPRCSAARFPLTYDLVVAGWSTLLYAEHRTCLQLEAFSHP